MVNKATQTGEGKDFGSKRYIPHTENRYPITRRPIDQTMYLEEIFETLGGIIPAISGMPRNNGMTLETSMVFGRNLADGRFIMSEVLCKDLPAEKAVSKFPRIDITEAKIIGSANDAAILVEYRVNNGTKYTRVVKLSPDSADNAKWTYSVAPAEVVENSYDRQSALVVPQGRLRRSLSRNHGPYADAPSDDD